MPPVEALPVARLASQPLPGEASHWLAFAVLVAVLLALDLFVFHRHDHKPTLRESAMFTVFWIAVGLAFNGLVWWWGVAEGLGSDPGIRFLSGYLVEKSLSMDNIFVFVVIFRFFQVPMMYQYRVLFWGILGAIVMRAVFILGGIKLIHHFNWVIPLFGAFLIYTAYKLIRHSEAEVHPDQNILLRTARRWFRVTSGDHHQHGHDFFARENGLLCVTPMLLVLLVIESTDVVFAVDSVPAIIGITNDPFIAFTSNIFAILGLRALYFLLAGVIDMFRFLHYGLAAVLAFVGLKMISEYVIKHVESAEWIGPYVHPLVTPVGSLTVIVALLSISIGASLLFVAKETEPKDDDATSRKDVDTR
ncbi:MAG TPA: TerC/Alx family metal homeostasis membrane protein [Thermoguttaceae bacterium]|nr:TerC/Alx family metal homeostasis membrane protein [Thermoguttaceae bacterium]